MLVEKRGNVMTEDVDVIAHQVNCRGVMGAGLAKQIKAALSENEFKKYRDKCLESNPPSELLGHMQRVHLSDGRAVANLFAEYKPTGKGLDTDYEALEKCFKKLSYIAPLNKRVKDAYNGVTTIAVPGYIGCGLAGGDWEFVYSRIIWPIFYRLQDIEMRIVYLDSSVDQLYTDAMKQIDSETGELLRTWHNFAPVRDNKETIDKWFAETFGKVA